MSVLPLLFPNLWEDMRRPQRVLDQNFGIGISPESLVPRPIHLYDLLPRNPSMKHSMLYCRPRKGEGGVSTVQADKDQFRVNLDVQQFEPEEINVKVIDRYVIVEGKHEEKQDEHGWISRQFTRKYVIPEQCDIEQVSSMLSSDGVLSIVVPRKQKPAPEDERVISIEQTGKPAVSDVLHEGKKPEVEKDAE